MSTDASQIIEIVSACLCQAKDAGIKQAINATCQQYPQYAKQIREHVGVLQEIGLLGEKIEDANFPQRLGEYRLLRRLGTGGMGVIFLAEQESLHRQVALKVIRPDQLYYPKSMLRFHREVEAIASLQHPNIVPVYGYGEESGIPYFAMERIYGCTLAEILEELRDLPLGELSGKKMYEALQEHRNWQEGETSQSGVPTLFADSWQNVVLRLIRQVAEALEHAHSRGILHRDVKPSNILLTATGRALLFDFGLASIGEDQKLTRSGSQVGSLNYMSPAQVRGEVEQLDERTDVYSLGVVLYELLTLKLPYAEKNRELTAQKILQGKSAAPRSWNKKISWELETVCFKATEVELSRRYVTAGDFARDLGHVIDNEPIEARRASPWRRAKKFVQRNPTVSVAAALTLLGSFGFALQQKQVREQAELLRQVAEEQKTTALLAQQKAEIKNQEVLAAKAEAELARQHAEEEAVKANEAAALAVRETKRAKLVVDFLTQLFQANDPYGTLGESITLKDVLNAGYEKIFTELLEDPQAQASLMVTLGDVYAKLSIHDKAHTLFERALQLRTKIFGENSLERAEALWHLAGVSYSSDYDSVEKQLREVFAIRANKLGETNNLTTVCLTDIGRMLNLQGRYDEAQRELSKTLRLMESNPQRDEDNYLNAKREYATSILFLGQFDKAILILEEILQQRIGRFGEKDPQTIITLMLLGPNYASAGNIEKGKELCERAMQLAQEVFPGEHSLNRHVTKYTLALVLQRAEQYAEATVLLKDVLKHLHADELFHLTTTNCSLAEVYFEVKDYQQAVEHFTTALATANQLFSEDHGLLVKIHAFIGYCYLELNEPKQAEEALRKYLQITEKKFQNDSEYYNAACYVGLSLALQERWQEAEQFLLPNISGLINSLGAENINVQRVLPAVVRLYEYMGKPLLQKKYQALMVK